jgi:hypothetical protein
MEEYKERYMNFLVGGIVKTTPKNVEEAHKALFHATMNLPQAAAWCGMTQREIKQTFREYLKYHAPDYEIPENSFTLSRREEQSTTKNLSVHS